MSNINIGTNERYISLAAGLTLIFAGIRRGDFTGFLMTVFGGYMILRGATGHDTVYKQAGVSTAVATNPQRVSVPHTQGIHVEATTTVNRPAADVYAFWRNFENLPQFMNHLERVEVMEGGRSRWTAKAPLGTTVTWEADIITERTNEVIGWRSVADSQIANAGSVRFRQAPGGRGTEIHVSLEYVPPAGQLGAIVARLLGEEPQVQIDEDLRRFKELMEAGEIPTTSGSQSPSPYTP
ncbi:MAG: SRPBCC family protein [Anaerolinea sp.]|nr:SRPBCC family protein [Anaerolinea sp.]